MTATVLAFGGVPVLIDALDAPVVALRNWSIGARRGTCRNTRGYLGVTWDRVNQKWRAQLGFRGRGIPLGRFSAISDAVAARKQAEIAYLGSFSPYVCRGGRP